ncbi:MAG TPA: D-alanine--D-alanine ligase [Nitrospiraceae bacterium]|nr:D-alanine--D-alanine ligase [Nitrospiraceae bacterium]
MAKKVTDKKVGVLMGGLSSEREVSLASGEAILKALQEKGYDVVAVDVDRDAAEQLRKLGVGVVFNALHGTYGEDGAIQGMLDVLGIPFTGSGVLASAVGMHKVVSKVMFKAHGLTVGPYAVIGAKERGAVKSLPGDIGFPAVVKPCAEGSSVGVSIVTNQDEFDPAMDVAFRYGDDVLIEKFIAGKEIQVGILGEKALGAIEIVPKEAFYNYRAKYEAGMSDHFFPARIPDAVYRRTLEAGLIAHRALGCRGYSRVDFIVNEGGDIYILELNTLPGMTATSLLPEIAKGVGIPFSDLVEEILRLAVA